MKMTLSLIVRDMDVFDTLDGAQAEAAAKAVNGTVYSWKTAGRHNWLEKGYRRVDTILFVVLPGMLPDCIRMPDDEVEDEDDEDDEEC